MTERDLDMLERAFKFDGAGMSAPGELVCMLIADIRKLREWKKKHQGVGLRDDDEFACINKCIPWNYFFDFRSLPGETIKHSPDCPDFTFNGELK